MFPSPLRGGGGPTQCTMSYKVTLTQHKMKNLPGKTIYVWKGHILINMIARVIPQITLLICMIYAKTLF